MSELPTIKTARTILAIAQPTDAEPLLAYQFENRAHLEPWEPLRASEFYTLDAGRERLEKSWDAFISGAALNFIAVDPQSKKIMATCNFTNIVRGAFLSCTLGYSVAGEWEGQGVMHEVATAGINYMFEVVGLHRVMACHMPENIRSERLIKKLGFEREGYAKSYLKIAGKWQDMVLNSRINPVP